MAYVTKPQPLRESTSLLLDFMRLGAALLVVAAHVTHAEFQAFTQVDLQMLGDLAVPLFFVLSGFMIRYVTRTRESSLRVYLVDRASRIYSVALPSMAITLLLTGTCYLVNRPVLLATWGGLLNHPIARILLNLTFVSQAWGHNSIPFINSPFWSLGYECFYYVLYGLVFYLRGWLRWVSVAVACVIIGPQVLTLLPSWWLGCWLYDLYAVTRTGRVRVVLVSLAAASIVLARLLAAFGHPYLWHTPQRALLLAISLPSPLALLHLPIMRATTFALLSSLYTGIILYFALLAVEPLNLSREHPASRAFRRTADGTFTIYLLHYPFFVLAVCLGLFSAAHPHRSMATVAAIVVLLTLLAIPFDALKNSMRRWLFRYFPANPTRLPAPNTPARAS